jgi:hypothetical protein
MVVHAARQVALVALVAEEETVVQVVGQEQQDKVMLVAMLQE